MSHREDVESKVFDEMVKSALLTDKEIKGRQNAMRFEALGGLSGAGAATGIGTLIGLATHQPGAAGAGALAGLIGGGVAEVGAEIAGAIRHRKDLAYSADLKTPQASSLLPLVGSYRWGKRKATVQNYLKHVGP